MVQERSITCSFIPPSEGAPLDWGLDGMADLTMAVNLKQKNIS